MSAVLRDVGAHRQRRPAARPDLVGGGLGALLVDVAEHDRRARARQHVRGRPADAAGGAGEHCDPIRQIERLVDAGRCGHLSHAVLRVTTGKGFEPTQPRQRYADRVSSCSLMNELTIVTLNLHGGQRNRRISTPRRRQHGPPPEKAVSNGAFDVAGALRSFDADVLVLQESWWPDEGAAAVDLVAAELRRDRALGVVRPRDRRAVAAHHLGTATPGARPDRPRGREPPAGTARGDDPGRRRPRRPGSCTGPRCTSRSTSAVTTSTSSPCISARDFRTRRRRSSAISGGGSLRPTGAP